MPCNRLDRETLMTILAGKSIDYDSCKTIAAVTVSSNCACSACKPL